MFHVKLAHEVRAKKEINAVSRETLDIFSAIA